MAGTNDFIPFATDTDAEVLSQAAYAALTERGSGFQPNTLGRAARMNKVWRQGSAMAAALGKFISDLGVDARDDGDIDALSDAIAAALAVLFPGLYPAGRNTATPGYIRLPGGLILQWCNNLTAASNSAGDGTVVWTLPVTLGSSIIGASFCATNLTVLTNTQRVVLGSLTSSTVTVYCGGGVPSQPAGVGISGFVLGT